MPYSKFTLQELKKKFGLKEHKAELFSNVAEIEPSAWLKESLQIGTHVTLSSEKARSELIVTPVLLELVKRNDFNIGLFSGVLLNADSNTDLIGECDFIISLRGDTYSLESPIIAMVEAKDNDIDLGIPQCIGQMLGALKFNEDDGKPIDTIFGCVTTGTEWQFLKLQNNTVYVANELYYIKDINNLLGLWQGIIDYYKPSA